jgi:hypothetical protein
MRRVAQEALVGQGFEEGDHVVDLLLGDREADDELAAQRVGAAALERGAFLAEEQFFAALGGCADRIQCRANWSCADRLVVQNFLAGQ